MAPEPWEKTAAALAADHMEAGDNATATRIIDAAVERINAEVDAAKQGTPPPT